jgi:hypothetical protein
MRPQGLKPALILDALRGAEAPLFHVTVQIREFFRNLFQAGAPGCMQPGIFRGVSLSG